MVHQEQSPNAGGILAGIFFVLQHSEDVISELLLILSDEMGMGKTIQAISLILTNKCPKSLELDDLATPRVSKTPKELDERWTQFEQNHTIGSEVSKVSLMRGGTLIVVPVTAGGFYDIPYACLRYNPIVSTI